MKQLLFTFTLISFTLSYSTSASYSQCITAIELDGVDDYMHTPFANYDFTNFTIEMWINSPDFSPNEVYVNWNQDSRILLGGWEADGSFNGGASGLSPSSINSGAGTTPSVNNWHHVAYVFDGSTQSIYIGGTLVATQATTGSVAQGTGFNSGLVIGARFTMGSQFTNTTFEDVRVWNVARTATEISSNAAFNLNGNETGLIAYYRFEDGIGSNTVTDLTGNGHTLTLYNMDSSTDWVPGLFSQPSQGTDVISNCGPYTWIDGNTYSADNNTATHTIVGGAAGGCDSIVTLDLTVNTPVDTSVTASSPDFTANDVSAGVTYQWIDCGNGNVALAGETGQMFTATATGSYAVVVTGANGCSDTSSCYPANFSGIDESNLSFQIAIAPNPTNGKFSIRSANYSGGVTIEISDLTGKLIQKVDATFDKVADSVHIDLTDAESGTYFVKVSDGLDSYVTRIVKK
ncbi:MAG: T9SS type A sorting domain-containing protein [Flavobacteriales bacterium]|nr:T9SS type A sorting domain-containing protein [Flavobacteriales bacterium]